MYHCGTAPALHHIANGMYGMVIVEPADGLPKVDKEFALVQSEWYLGPRASPSTSTRRRPARRRRTSSSSTASPTSTRTRPIKVETGERVRIFVLDAGPNIDSSFHIVGTIFDTVIKEGIHLTKGNAGSGAPRPWTCRRPRAAIVEFTTAEDGLYPMVTHAFNFVGRGSARPDQGR